MRVLDFGWVLVLAAHGLVACGSDPTSPLTPPTATFASGARLRARVVHLGTAEVFAEWVDTERDAPCAFLEVEGTLRCVPPVRDAFYRDAACTDRVVVHTDADCGAPRPVAVTFREDLTEPRYSMHALAPTPERVGQVYRRTGGACRLDTASASYEVYALGAALPPERFARAELVESPLESGLTLVRLVAEDGAFIGRDLRDPERNTSCVSGVGALYEGPYRDRCAPMGRIFGDVDTPLNAFADAACSRPLQGGAVAPYGGSAPPLFVEFAQASDPVCEYPTVERLMRLVPTDLPRVYHRDETAACVVTPSAPDAIIYEVGEVLPPETFPRVPRLEVGAPHGVETFFSDRGAPLVARLVFEGCVPVRLAGELRCVPNAVGAANFDLYFADEACVDRLYNASSVCYDEAIVLVGVGHACEPTLAFGLGAAWPHDRLVYFREAAGAPCSGPFVQQERFDLRRLEPVDPASLPTITFEVR